MSLEEYLQECQNIELDKIERNDLVDISCLNLKKPSNDPNNLKQYIEQVNNPYFFKVGKTAVKVSFSNNNIALSDILEHYFKTLNNTNKL